MQEYFVDLHVHIGRSSLGKITKRGTSNKLTFSNIAYESHHRKGIHVIGVVDCVSPWIIRDIEELLHAGELNEIPGGGVVYSDDLVILLGSEIETRESHGCSAHSLMFFPSLAQVKEFSRIMDNHMTNLEYNATVSRLSVQELFDIADSLEGIFIPAHIFTPYKGLYGNCTDRLARIFNPSSLEKIPSIELGLSADTDMGTQISELDSKTFLSNSDAHSLGRMGREYNTMLLGGLDFREVVKALRNQDGRRITANYGLDPKLGKYYRTFCMKCENITELPPPITKCPNDPKHRVVMGVLDRLVTIRDREESPKDTNRPPYHYQIPLEFIPGVGPKTIDRLIDAFGSEMNILHKASREEIREVVSEDITDMIVKGRGGELTITHGGGGKYGKVEH
ncbi:MAG TPA: endonuclease Q family protein [Clostridia bacterium]|nr:endonuclease Q family protein [Clostridia bacterium]